MNDRHHVTDSSARIDAEEHPAPPHAKLPYQRPELRAFGRVEELTRASGTTGSEFSGKKRQ
jgi:hypothetical protein